MTGERERERKQKKLGETEEEAGRREEKGWVVRHSGREMAEFRWNSEERGSDR